MENIGKNKECVEKGRINLGLMRKHAQNRLQRKINGKRNMGLICKHTISHVQKTKYRKLIGSQYGAHKIENQLNN